MRLQGKVALITGAGSGIGRETALLFAKEGATVIINDFSEEAGIRTKEEIIQVGGDALFIQADVTNSAEVQRMVEEVIEKKQRIDILFNNAGVSGLGTLHETSEELWDKVVNINIKGVYLPSKYAIPRMIKQNEGVIINMSSCIAEIGLMRRAVYSATKGAVLALTKSMQVDQL